MAPAPVIHCHSLCMPNHPITPNIPSDALIFFQASEKRECCAYRIGGPVNECYQIDPSGLFLAVELRQYKLGFEALILFLFQCRSFTFATGPGVCFNRYIVIRHVAVTSHSLRRSPYTLFERADTGLVDVLSYFCFLVKDWTVDLLR